MNRFTLFFLLNVVSLIASSQTGQLNISRIDLMPNLPLPLQIRDWSLVAGNYDAFIFDQSKTGQYLPLIKLGTPGAFNYADNSPVFLDTYIGSDNHLSHAEAINLLPAMVGASLVGIDKSNQNGINWVSKTKDFFNLKNGQNIYLNNYSTTSGNDWWYDVMPNVYFFQLKYLYPNAAPEFNIQFTAVANRWLECVTKLGGSTKPWAIPQMNYRAFNFSTGLPLNESVPEPESAGSIAWLLYNAYLETGNRKYVEGAQLALDFLAAVPSNPSYELQLPYGTVTAARMNAVEGTNYPVQKMLDWCFNRGNLRGWGAIVGTWGGFDVSGLIGEANDSGNDYAFIMNGYQQAAALAPIPKYDKRYARALAKWILNITNASRLFYSNALPETQQDSYGWASANDPNACIPYESMKQAWLGKTPFATGDALGGGWAATNLSLYSGSSVGYLAAVSNITNVPEILQINLNKTDFYGDNTLPAYLYFNPTTAEKQVLVSLPSGTFDIYDAITETVIFKGVSVSFLLPIPSNEVRLIRLYTAGITPEVRNNKLYAGKDVLDYNYGYSFSVNLRVKALSTDKNVVAVNTNFNVYCEPGNIKPDDVVHFEWFIDNVSISGKSTSQVQITAPANQASFILKCRISSNGQIAEDTIRMQTVTHIPAPPVLKGIQSAFKYTAVAETNTFTATVEPAIDEVLQYEWTATIGTLNQTTGISTTWLAPGLPGIGTLTLKVTNQDLLSSTFTMPVLVKDTAAADQAPLIWYPFDSDSKNVVADRLHATAFGVSKTEDARNLPDLAYRFSSGSNIISTENNNDLNFTQAISLSCWFKCTTLGSERFIVSHGSWQQRFKLSITPEGKLRWTIKTATGVADLDSSKPIALNEYYHVTAVYNGYAMELYIDGVLETFKPFTGAMLASTKPLTIGRMDNLETQYSFFGSIDEVKLWNVEIPIPQIAQLKNQWALPNAIHEIEQRIAVYPNPADDFIYLEIGNGMEISSISFFAVDGKVITTAVFSLQPTGISIAIPPDLLGLYLIRLTLKNGNVISKKIIIR